MNNVNVRAVAVGVVSSFLLDGLWYSPVLFGRRVAGECGRMEFGSRAHLDVRA
jgi:hypothetical protein